MRPQPAFVDSETHPHICGSCESPLVQPLEWRRAGASHWQVELRCPECEWCGTGVFDEETVARYDVELERGCDALLADLARLSVANMEDDVERFVTALHAGHILAEDF